MPHPPNPDVVPVVALPEELAPDHRHSIITLRYGQKVLVRPVTALDGPMVGAFLEHVSLGGRRGFLLTRPSDLPVTAGSLRDVDGEDRFAVVAFDEDQHVVGHAAYQRMYGPRAEVAVEVADGMRHLGLGTRLILWLARVAEQHAITEFAAEVVAEDSEMLVVMQEGFAPVYQRGRGLITIEFPTSNWRHAARRME